MNVLWTSQEAATATGGRTTGDWTASGVSIDSRSLVAGDLFVALKDVRDGHEFVAQALANGAAAALVSHVPDGIAADAPLLIVDDVLAALVALGQAARARTGAKIIAVTGSVGKTSTKDMLRTVLAGQGRVHVATDSYNNHWGVPLTLARMQADSQFAVIEIGMNHPGEIAPLAKMTRPDVALLTNVAAVHMAAFADIDGIAREKAAIFDGMTAGVAVINADQPVSQILSDAAQDANLTVLSFGKSPSADFSLQQVQITDEATVVQAVHNGSPLLFKLGVPGKHFAMNALGALAAAHAVGADLAIAAVDIANWSPPSGRGSRETIVLDFVDNHLRLTLIDDAFNASPISMTAALEVLAGSRPDKPGRKIAILGDMLELGDDEIHLHTEIAKLAALTSIDVIHCVGPRMEALYDLLPANQRGSWHATAPEMAATVHAQLHAGDIILVKGSKGSKVSLVVDAIRKLSHPQAQQLQGTH
ncbi:MAG: UDP-N-acetylmuramoyl-tripeptide--D-alanyl-D-alanine ligase [Paracoccaceae bacterium]